MKIYILLKELLENMGSDLREMVSGMSRQIENLSSIWNNERANKIDNLENTVSEVKKSSADSKQKLADAISRFEPSAKLQELKFRREDNIKALAHNLNSLENSQILRGSTTELQQAAQEYMRTRPWVYYEPDSFRHLAFTTDKQGIMLGEGYLNRTTYIETNISNLRPENIKKGVNVGGVIGTCTEARVANRGDYKNITKSDITDSADPHYAIRGLRMNYFHYPDLSTNKFAWIDNRKMIIDSHIARARGTTRFSGFDLISNPNSKYRGCYFPFRQAYLKVSYNASNRTIIITSIPDPIIANSGVVDVSAPNPDYLSTTETFISNTGSNSHLYNEECLLNLCAFNPYENLEFAIVMLDSDVSSNLIIISRDRRSDNIKKQTIILPESYLFSMKDNDAINVLGIYENNLYFLINPSEGDSVIMKWNHEKPTEVVKIALPQRYLIDRMNMVHLISNFVASKYVAAISDRYIVFLAHLSNHINKYDGVWSIAVVENGSLKKNINLPFMIENIFYHKASERFYIVTDSGDIVFTKDFDTFNLVDSRNKLPLSRPHAMSVRYNLNGYFHNISQSSRYGWLIFSTNATYTNDLYMFDIDTNLWHLDLSTIN